MAAIEALIKMYTNYYLVYSQETKLTFQSEERFYRKLIDETPHDYAYWEQQCSRELTCDFL